MATCSSARARSRGRQLHAANGGRSRIRGICRTRSRRSSADGSAVITKPTDSGGHVRLRHGSSPAVVRGARHRLLPLARRRRRLHVSARSPTSVSDQRARRADVAARRDRRRTRRCSRYHAGWSGEARAAFSWPGALREGEGHGRDCAKRVEMAGLAVRRMALRVLGRGTLGGPTSCRRIATRPRSRSGRAWRMRRRTHGGPSSTRVIRADAVRAARRLTGMGRQAVAVPERGCSALWPDARRPEARRRERASDDRGESSRRPGSSCGSCAATGPATRATSPTWRSSPTTRRAYDLIVAQVTASDAVKQHFGRWCAGPSRATRLRNVLALNFVLRCTLGGGGPRSPALRQLSARRSAAPRAHWRSTSPTSSRHRAAAPPRRHWADEILDLAAKTLSGRYARLTSGPIRDESSGRPGRPLPRRSGNARPLAPPGCGLPAL